MRKKSGSIVNISSIVGLTGNVGQANYAASKAGIIGFTKSVAKEYGKKNIRCNAVAPGFIETDMTDLMSDEARKNIFEKIALARLGQADEVANLVNFLVSDQASYITGQTISIDGGL